MDLIDSHAPIHKRLNHFYNTNRIPHIIFYGNSGCGKSTIAYEFIKKIYHNNERLISNNVMFVNCAHGKGIKFIREEIKFFAKTNTHVGVSFKSVVLLNADHLTIDAQSALRRCIEQFSINTRFFIVIENKHKLMMPILSRFCEIYVPSIYDTTDNKIINLHQKQLNYSFPYRSTLDEKIQKELNSYLSFFVTECYDYNDILNIVEKLYEIAFCCHDIIKWVQNHEEWTNKEKANIGMCYEKVKLEFRNEKMLMTFMLNIILNCPEIDIKHLSFM